MPVITKIADAKSSTENDVYNNRSIQELEQRLEELVLEEPPCQTKVNVQSSVLPTKETAHDSSFTYKQYFKLKLFSRGAVELLAIGAALSGTKYAQQSKEYGSTSTISTISSVVTDSLLCGSMNLLLYNSGFSYSQMLVANLLAYPVKSHSFLGGFGQLAGGILSTFLGGRGLGFNVGINAQPITIKIDPLLYNEVIAEASKQTRFVVDKIEQTGENLIILSFEQGRITLKEAGTIVQVIVDDAIANTFKGAQLTIDNFGNILKARIDQGAQEAKIIINYMPFIARKTSVSIIDGLKHGLLQAVWYSYSRHLQNEIQNYALQTQGPNLIKLLVDFVWTQRIRPEFSVEDKKYLYQELLNIVNTPSNSLEERRQLFLLIGYAAIHDPSMRELNKSFWPFFSTNHTKSVLAAIPIEDIAVMLENLDYKAIHQNFQAIKIIRETLLLSDVVAGEANINDYINKLKEQLELSEQQQKIMFSIITLTTASIALLFYNRNSQYLQNIKNRFSWLFTREAIEIAAVGITILVVMNVIQQQNSINKEILRCVNSLSKANDELGEQIKRYEPIIFENVDKLKIDIEYVTREINDLHDFVRQIENSIEQKYQTQQKAVSFLYDKMKDAHKVAFKSKYFSPQEVAAQFTGGKYAIPVPDSFEENDCIFFSVSRGNDKSHGGAILTTSSVGRIFSPHCAPWGNWLEAAYLVIAAKPVITEQERIQKKEEYRLT